LVEYNMLLRLFLLANLMVFPALVLSQSASPKMTTHYVTITGCLTKNAHGEYELVDQKGVHNLVYKSERVDLESYVGKSVSLTGEQSAMPSTDNGTSNSMPHFVVKKLEQGAGKCGKSSE
jgi:hypothetical protein